MATERNNGVNWLVPVVPVNSLYLSLFLSDTHLRLEFHQSIHCTCHCFSQTPIVRLEFHQSIHCWLVSIVDGFSIRHWWNIYEKQWYSVDSPSRRWVSERNNDRYSELTGETPVVDGCLRETMTVQWIDWWNSSRRWVSERNNVPVSVWLWNSSRRWVSPNDRYSELTGETPVVDGFHQSIHCWLVSIVDFSIRHWWNIYDWSFTSQFTVDWCPS